MTNNMAKGATYFVIINHWLFSLTLECKLTVVIASFLFIVHPKANKAIINFFKKLSKKNVRIIKGMKSKEKVLKFY